MNIQHAESLSYKSLKKAKGKHLLNNMTGRLLLKIFTGLALLLCLGFAAELAYKRLCQSDFFQITAMKIEGNRMVSNEQIHVLSKIDIHSNLLALKTSQVQSLLQSHPWIAWAEVKRDWPNRLVITVREKKPVALLNRNSGLFYLDSKGILIAAANPDQELDFPVITGLEDFSFTAEQSGSSPGVLQDVMKLLQLAARNNSFLPEQNISEIHLSKNGEMILYLLEKTFPIHMGSEGDVSKRYYRLVQVLRDLYRIKEFERVSYIRLDYQKDTILVGKETAGRMHRG